MVNVLIREAELLAIHYAYVFHSILGIQRLLWFIKQDSQWYIYTEGNKYSTAEEIGINCTVAPSVEVYQDYIYHSQYSFIYLYK